MTAAATHTASPIAPGYKLDRYELLCPIAEGGMASVWVARQRGKHGFEKLVAIKTILPKFASDPRFQEMFLDEARIASRIEHLNVAQIFDLGEEHDILYLAMEYVDGEALSKLNRACQRKGIKIPTGVVMRVLADTCSGLHEAHELRDGGRLLEIVHRDVSPHNILVSSKGIAKLIDFGIAKARSRVGNDTNSGVLKGKIQYMAPEQALGRPVDRRADIWAIGAILYHLLSGRPAYEGDNQLATLHLLGSGRPPVPLPDSVHPAIRDIVRTALSHTPENRYATAAEMREAIEDAMVEAMVPTTSADVSAFASEHLAERAEKRRQSIDLALAAAAERQRVEDLLRPTSERSSNGATPVSGSQPSFGPPIPAGSAGALPLESLTSPEGPTAKAGGSGNGVGRLTTRMSEPPVPSYATLGSAALDASEPPVVRSSRKGVIAVLVLIAAVAAGATVVSFTMSKPKPPPIVVVGPANAPPPAVSSLPSAATATASAPPPSAKATPAPTTTRDRIPTISATALPTVAPPAPPPPRWTPPPQPPPAAVAPPPPAAAPPAATTPPPKPKKTTVDDGF